MITVKYVRNMARYNAWQNENLLSAAEGLSDEDRRADRGAFFGSIHATFSHLLWADTMWMSRFDGWGKPAASIAESVDWVKDWPDLVSRRRTADAQITRWADRQTDAALAGDLAWFSGAAGRDMSAPKAFCVMHFFNHQTHHRGQIHAMLTAAGAQPGDTDLFLLENKV